MTSFDAETFSLLAASEEVEIVTAWPDGRLMRTIIWVVVEGDEVFVRSVRGDRGRWYQAALDRPTDVELRVDGRRIAVRADLAADEASVARCSRGLETKYRRDPSLPSMLRPRVLGTTLRLQPR